MSDKSRDQELPAIKPSQDEVASYRRSGRSDAPRQSNFNGVLVFVIVLMAIMMGVGGFALWEVQQELEQSNRLLAQSQDKIRELDNRLSDTGDTASQKFKSMEAQIETNVSEIDKLWGVSYRTNRPNIEQNKRTLEQVSKQMATLDKELAGRVATLQKDFDKLSKDMIETRQNILTDNEEMVTQVAIVRGQIQDQNVQVEGNRRKLSALEQDMGKVQEAIDVIDRYRQQINQRLVELQSQIRANETAATAP